MQKKKTIILTLILILVSILVFLVANHFFKRRTEEKEDVPQAAIFILGDSNVDRGLTKDYNTTFNPFNFPYAIDHHERGRFSNSETLGDSIASWLLMKSPISLSQMRVASTNEIKAGINFAFGASGALPETGKKYGKTVTLQDQMRNFSHTMDHFYWDSIYNRDDIKIQQFISNSIYLINTGQNDVIEFFEGGASQNFPTDMVVKSIMNVTKDLYKRGAERIVVFELLPIGCSPLFTSINKTEQNGCVRTINKVVSDINKYLEIAINDFKKVRPKESEKIILGRTFELAMDMITNPDLHGFEESKKQCCETDNRGLCLPSGKICNNRSKHLYFDGRHFTHAAYSTIGAMCAGDQLEKKLFHK